MDPRPAMTTDTWLAMPQQSNGPPGRVMNSADRQIDSLA